MFKGKQKCYEDQGSDKVEALHSYSIANPIRTLCRSWLSLEAALLSRQGDLPAPFG